MLPRFANGNADQIFDWSDHSNIFAKNVFELSALSRNISQLWDTQRGSPLQVGQEYDFIAAPDMLNTVWSGLNLHMMRMARPNRKFAIVTAARNEGPYLVEWIAHHLAIGCEAIFIYTNDNDDESDLLLNALHQAGFITLIRNKVGPAVSPQKKAYEHAVHFLRELRAFEWAAFLDLDELLVPSLKYDYNIINFLSAFESLENKEQVAAIFVNWAWYHDQSKIEAEPGLMSEKFTTCSDYSVVKSICHMPTISHMHHVHAPDLEMPFVNSAFSRTEIEPWRCVPPSYDGAKLNHYFHKSYEEFLVKSFRGIGDSAVRTAGRNLSQYFTMQPKWDSRTCEFERTILDRSKEIMDKLFAVDGVAQAHTESIAAHKRIAEVMSGGDLLASYNSAREAAIESGMAI